MGSLGDRVADIPPHEPGPRSTVALRRQPQQVRVEIDAEVVQQGRIRSPHHLGGVQQLEDDANTAPDVQAAQRPIMSPAGSVGAVVAGRGASGANGRWWVGQRRTGRTRPRARSRSQTNSGSSPSCFTQPRRVGEV